MKATIGFIGASDPANGLAALYNKGQKDEPGEWTFQAIADEKEKNPIPTGFTHTPGQWAVFRIETELDPLIANLFINDQLVATHNSFIPTGPLAFELQVWNRPLDHAHSQTSMWVDYLYITQKR